MTVPVSSNDDGTPMRLGPVICGESQAIGGGFSANHLSQDMFDGRMDPLLMADDFVMTEPTFAPHLHVGISAVTALFEDSSGAFLNRDTLVHDVELQAGDLYWLAAAGGAVHEERPAPGACIHALQVFVDLPARLKGEPARALHVRAAEVPVIEAPGCRVRVLLGRSGRATGADGTPEEMTMLDGSLAAGGRFTHLLPDGRQAWIYAVSGELSICCEGGTRALRAGHATTVKAGPCAEIALTAEVTAHFVLMAGRPVREAFDNPRAASDDFRRAPATSSVGGLGPIPV